MDIKSLLHSFISPLVSRSSNDFSDEFFDALTSKMDDYFDTLKSNSIDEMKHKNKSKMKGIFFEEMCYQLCLINAFPSLAIKEVWRFSDFPSDLRQEFGLRNQDMGIDLIAKTKNNNWIAIQCKYRKKPKKNYTMIQTYNQTTDNISTFKQKKITIRWCVSWKDLATFYELCNRTGPTDDNLSIGTWSRHIVMTNAPYIRSQGKKGKKDYNICYKSFKNISKDTWLKLIGYEGRTLNDNEKIVKKIVNLEIEKNKEKVDIEDIRQKRLLFLEKIKD